MTYTADDLFTAAYAVSAWRTESACAVWNRLLGSEQSTYLALANGAASDLTSCAMDLMDRLMHR